ncbi:flagellar basal body L-ring protein FlgH [bacterium]|nr:flagellar basal body L-ring protein FlgH [bacterium]
MKTTTIAALSALLILSAGCAATNANKPSISGYRPVDFQPTNAETPKEHRRHGSSLWVDNNDDNYLFTDQKARRVGDVVTVNILEDSDAQGKADTKTEKTSTIGAGVDGFFGFEQVAARRNPNLRLDTLVGAKTGTKFNGKGETRRSGRLVATMSCIVVDVLPNGNLVVRGERRMKLNAEDYIMVMSGIVRPRDVASDNTVPSTMVADARIEYLGEGVLADKMKAGWFTRAFEKVWPF